MYTSLHPLHKTKRNQEAQGLGGKQVCEGGGCRGPSQLPGPWHIPSCPLPKAEPFKLPSDVFHVLCLTFQDKDYIYIYYFFFPSLPFPKMLVPFGSELAIYNVYLG